jgi:hypothetical protein
MDSNLTCPDGIPDEPSFNVEASAERLIVIVFIGLPIALISVIENAILLFALARRRVYRQSSFVYLIFLAISDIVVCVGYVPVIALDAFDTFLVRHSIDNQLNTRTHAFRILNGFTKCTQTI